MSPVARVFLGVVGSLPMGLVLAWCLIELAAHSWAAALLLPLYYLIDATLTLLRRLLKREASGRRVARTSTGAATTNGLRCYQASAGFRADLALAALAVAAVWNPSRWSRPGC